jgi:hypothetical protein
MLEMKVGQNRRRKRNMTITTSAIVMTRVSLHVANGRSDRNCAIVHHIQMHTWRQPGPQLREDFVNQIGCANNVRVRLFENDQQHGAFVVEKAGLIAICLRVNCGADIAQRYRCAIMLRDNDRLILFGVC